MPARLRRVGFLLAIVAPVVAAWAPSGVRAQVGRPTCESCHGELELLRQHVSTLEEARALVSPIARLAASAHGSMTCADCHDGFRRFPHAESATTRSCRSCHEDVSGSWDEGVHALDSAATCAACHGTHEVAPASELRTTEGALTMREACGSCHFEPATAAYDPHADSVSCAGCHEPHRTLPVEDDRASTHPLNQARTCGACHDTVAGAWSADVHGGVVPELSTPGGRVPEGASRAEPPACSGCHGYHDMVAPAGAGFRREMVERCAHCHEPYAESFADSYHGQATTLGSEIVATCADCHGSHGILPASDPRSSVSDERRLDTCRTCHEQATAGFALFQPHADHNDRERYPFVYWSYHLMTTLLIGVFIVFGTHTALWLARLGFDALRGTSRGAGHDAGGGS
jgi:hypothetical protein